MKIVQNALFRSCAARFGQIAFVSVKVVKIVTLAVNSLQNWKTGALFMKIVQNARFRSCAARFGQIKFVSIKVLKFVTLASNSLQNGKTVRFPWKLYKTLFSGHAGRFGPNRTLRVKLLKIVRLVSNSLQNGKTVRFSWKLYKTLFSCHAQHVLANSHFWGSKLSKSSHWPQILSKTGKQYAFHENCTKPSFQVMRSTFWPNRIFESQSCQNRHTGLKISPKRGKSELFMNIVQNARFRSYAARFGQIAFLRVKVVKIVTLAWNSFQNGKTVRFSLKLYKTLVSGHAQHVLAKLHLWASKLSKSSHWPEKLVKTRKQCAFHENCTKRAFQVMRSTFWPIRIFDRQSCQNRHTGLEFSSKRENSALSIKIVQNALFRWCAARFGQNAFLCVKVVKVVTLAWNSLLNGKTVRFSWKLYKTLVSGHAQEVFPKSHLSGSNFSKSLDLSQILFKTEKQCAFHENCTKRSFQVMRSTFWPNRIFERQSCQNRHTALKFSPKRGKGARFMKIVQNARFRSCAARFGQIAFLSVKVVKIVTLAWNSLQNEETVRFPWKLYKTGFSGHAQHVLAKSHFWASKLSKSSHCPQILSKTGKGCAFHENCTKRSFQVMRSTFWPNRIFERQSCQNRHTSLKFSSKRENCALFIKIVQNARFGSCAARLGQIAFVSVKVVKIVTLAWKARQNEETVRFPWKLYKTGFSGHAEHVLAKSHFWPSKLSKSSHWPGILFKTGKQCAFHKNCTKRAFQVMRSTFWPKRIFKRQSCQSRHTGLKFSSKRENSALFMKIVRNARFRSCAARFGQIAFLGVKVVKIVTLAWRARQNGKKVRFLWKLYKTLVSGHAQEVLPKSHLSGSNFSKSLDLSQILFKTGKECAFNENCTKRSFQVIRSTFWPNGIFERQSCQNRHTGLECSSKRENSALFMKIVQNASFRSCAARFGQIAFLSVKVVKIVSLASNSLQNGKTVCFSWKLYKTLVSRHAQHVLAK